MVRQARHVEYALGRFHPDVLVGQQLALGPPLAGEHPPRSGQGALRGLGAPVRMFPKSKL